VPIPNDSDGGALAIAAAPGHAGPFPNHGPIDLIAMRDDLVVTDAAAIQFCVNER
jgi:hypothetical protein